MARGIVPGVDHDPARDHPRRQERPELHRGTARSGRTRGDGDLGRAAGIRPHGSDPPGERVRRHGRDRRANAQSGTVHELTHGPFAQPHRARDLGAALALDRADESFSLAVRKPSDLGQCRQREGPLLHQILD
jgi:hypothetical protein